MRRAVDDAMREAELGHVDAVRDGMERVRRTADLVREYEGLPAGDASLQSFVGALRSTTERLNDFLDDMEEEEDEEKHDKQKKRKKNETKRRVTVWTRRERRLNKELYADRAWGGATIAHPVTSPVLFSRTVFARSFVHREQAETFLMQSRRACAALGEHAVILPPLFARARETKTVRFHRTGGSHYRRMDDLDDTEECDLILCLHVRGPIIPVWRKSVLAIESTTRDVVRVLYDLSGTKHTARSLLRSMRRKMM